MLPLIDIATVRVYNILNIVSNQLNIYTLLNTVCKTKEE